MTLPSAVFGLLCALLVGALFHIIVDGGPFRLLLYLMLSVGGFAAGAWIARAQSWNVIPVGPLDVGVATIGSLVFLGVGHWLSMVRVQTTGPGNHA